MQAVGAAAKRQRKSEATIKLPKNEELLKVLGMEEGEELAVGSGRPMTVSTGAAMVASPDDPFEADQFGTNSTHEEPWWAVSPPAPSAPSGAVHLFGRPSIHLAARPSPSLSPSPLPRRSSRWEDSYFDGEFSGSGESWVPQRATLLLHISPPIISDPCPLIGSRQRKGRGFALFTTKFALSAKFAFITELQFQICRTKFAEPILHSARFGAANLVLSANSVRKVLIHSLSDSLFSPPLQAYTTANMAPSGQERFLTYSDMLGEDEPSAFVGLVDGLSAADADDAGDGGGGEMAAGGGVFESGRGSTAVELDDDDLLALHLGGGMDEPMDEQPAPEQPDDAPLPEPIE